LCIYNFLLIFYLRNTTLTFHEDLKIRQRLEKIYWIYSGNEVFGMFGSNKERTALTSQVCRVHSIAALYNLNGSVRQNSHGGGLLFSRCVGLKSQLFASLTLNAK
jgi:hypothetical protein